MRRQLALASLAVTSMVVLAFVVPLALLVRSVAADRALNSAEREAQTLAPTLATISDPATLRQLVEGTDASAEGDLSVFLADGTVLGARAVADDNVELARRGRAFTTDAPDGRQVLVPVVAPAGRVDVVRVFVPDGVLERSVGSAWLVLGLLAMGLVAAAAIFADRLGRSVVGPARELARTAERLSDGELTARVEPAGPPELVEVGSTMNRLAGRITMLLLQEREDVADLSHRLRTPVTALRLDADGLRDPDERERLSGDVDALARTVDWLIDEARHPRRASESETCDLVEVTPRSCPLLGRARRRPGTAVHARHRTGFSRGRGVPARPRSGARRAPRQCVRPHR